MADTITLTPAGVPIKYKAPPCRAAGCSYWIERQGDEYPTAFVHRHLGKDKRFPISRAVLEDVNHDLWADVQRWMIGLHNSDPDWPGYG